MKSLLLLGVCTLALSLAACSSSNSGRVLLPNPSAENPGQVDTPPSSQALSITKLTLSENELAMLSDRALHVHDICWTAWEHIPNPPLKDNPFKMITGDFRSWNRSLDVQGLGTTRALSTKFSRLSGKLTMGKTTFDGIDCPFPTEWRLSYPGLAVETYPAFRKIRAVSKKNPQPHLVSGAYESIAGLIYHHAVKPLEPKVEDDFDLGWFMKERTLSSAEVATIRSAFSISAETPVSVSSTFSQIELKDIRPIKALSIDSDSDSKHAPLYWVVPTAYRPESNWAKPFFKREGLELAGKGESPAYDDVSSWVRQATDSSVGLVGLSRVWDIAQASWAEDASYPLHAFSPANLSRFLQPHFEDLKAGQTLWARLVWNPTGVASYYLTMVALRPTGVVEVTGTYELSRPDLLGLPDDLL